MNLGQIDTQRALLRYLHAPAIQRADQRQHKHAPANRKDGQALMAIAA